jgi:hypothetical protein
MPKCDSAKFQSAFWFDFGWLTSTHNQNTQKSENVRTNQCRVHPLPSISSEQAWVSQSCFGYGEQEKKCKNTFQSSAPWLLREHFFENSILWDVRLCSGVKTSRSFKGTALLPLLHGVTAQKTRILNSNALEISLSKRSSKLHRLPVFPFHDNSIKMKISSQCAQNDTYRWTPMYSVKNLFQATLSNTSLRLTGLGLNLGLCGEGPTTTGLSHYAVI